MSDRTSLANKRNRQKTTPELQIALQDRILNSILERGWTDYDNFCYKLARNVAELSPRTTSDLAGIIGALRSQFFELNNFDRKSFIESFPAEDVLDILGRFTEIGSVTFSDIFTETSRISIDEGRNCLLNLKRLEEHAIQNALSDSLREKDATDSVERKGDTVLEVADREHFSLEVKGIPMTFAIVVKGYNSVRGKTIRLRDIMYQVTRAYNRTNPDHILLVLAKNPEDSMISELIQYGKSTGNQGLVIICDPVTLARFLKARGLI